MVRDAKAAPQHRAIGDGYKAVVITYGFLAAAPAHDVDAVKAML